MTAFAQIHPPTLATALLSFVARPATSSRVPHRTIAHPEQKSESAVLAAPKRLQIRGSSLGGRVQAGFSKGSAAVTWSTFP